MTYEHLTEQEKIELEKLLKQQEEIKKKITDIRSNSGLNWEVANSVEYKNRARYFSEYTRNHLTKIVCVMHKKSKVKELTREELKVSNELLRSLQECILVFYRKAEEE